MTATNRERLAQEVAAEHEALRKETAALSARLDAWDAGKVQQQEDLVDHLRSFRDHLRRHFEQEERGGYLAGVDDKSTQASREAQELVAQHREFEDRVDHLAGRIGSGTETSIEAAKKELADLIRDLADHERAEDALFQRLVLRDVGEGD